MKIKIENRKTDKPFFCFILFGKGFSIFSREKIVKKPKEESFPKFKYF